MKQCANCTHFQDPTGTKFTALCSVHNFYPEFDFSCFNHEARPQSPATKQAGERDYSNSRGDDFVYVNGKWVDKKDVV